MTYLLLSGSVHDISPPAGVEGNNHGSGLRRESRQHLSGSAADSGMSMSGVLQQSWSYEPRIWIWQSWSILGTAREDLPNVPDVDRQE